MRRLVSVLLAGVATTLWTCWTFGGSWLEWVFDTLTFGGQVVPGTELVLAMLVFGVLILPGLAVIWLGMLLVKALGTLVSTGRSKDGKRA